MRNALTFIKSPERFKNDPEDHGWALRVAKAICLLEFIRDLPRTDANLAAVLVDIVGRAAPLNEVQAAVKRLNTAQFIRNTEEGWKLQTAQEKNWETERGGDISNQSPVSGMTFHAPLSSKSLTSQLCGRSRAYGSNHKCVRWLCCCGLFDGRRSASSCQ